MAKITKNPTNEEAFEAFLVEIGNAGIGNWVVLAEALGVDRTTLIRWRKHPRAKQALIEAINDNIKKMEQAGTLDWKMYREKLKMLGVKDKTTLEHEAGDSIKGILDTIEQTNYGEFADKVRSKIAGQTVANVQPVQNQGQTGANSDVPPQPDAGEVHS